VIDSHCHLADKAFAGDLAAVLLRAEEHGVHSAVTIADSLQEARRCMEIADEYEQVFCTVGVHPHNAKDWQPDDGKQLRMLALSSPKVRAVGEIGLDYHYDHSPRDTQRAVFREQLTLAAALSLPAVVHCREAIQDLKEILTAFPAVPFVIHCCTEVWEDVAPLVEQGAYLGFTAIATYPKSEDIRRTIRECPMDRVLIETDAPYLAPAPHRGGRNEPAYVREVAKLIAEVKSLSLAEVDAITTKNTIAFYRL
jgi:TatD DNase family protein